MDERCEECGGRLCFPRSGDTPFCHDLYPSGQAPWTIRKPPAPKKTYKARHRSSVPHDSQLTEAAMFERFYPGQGQKGETGGASPMNTGGRIFRPAIDYHVLSRLRVYEVAYGDKVARRLCMMISWAWYYPQFVDHVVSDLLAHPHRVNKPDNVKYSMRIPDLVLNRLAGVWERNGGFGVDESSWSYTDGPSVTLHAIIVAFEKRYEALCVRKPSAPADLHPTVWRTGKQIDWEEKCQRRAERMRIRNEKRKAAEE